MDREIFSAYQKYYRSKLLDDCIPFWLNSDLLDKEYGGYITRWTGKAILQRRQIRLVSGKMPLDFFRPLQQLRQKGGMG